MKMSRKKVVVGLSGGVDSSVTALVLKQAGYDVHGVFLKMWTKDELTPACSQESDRQDATKIAAQLGIPLVVVDKEAVYRQDILDAFYEAYAHGLTPNPDAQCNRLIKFPSLFEVADKIGAEFVATGHYARIVDGQLTKGLDPNKDQSYFLYGLKREWLPQILFPVGELAKPAVREVAEQHHLVTAKKKDSQGLCFLGKIDVKTFLVARIPIKVGKIVTVEGETIGQHDGVAFYTIGQRKGINIPDDVPYYVVKRDFANNRLTVAKGANNPGLMARQLTARITNQLVDELPSQALAQIRYRQPDQVVSIEPGEHGQVTVSFTEPQRAITPGQAIVFYDDQGVVLGGGTIEANLELDPEIG